MLLHDSRGISGLSIAGIDAVLAGIDSVKAGKQIIAYNMDAAASAVSLVSLESERSDDTVGPIDTISAFPAPPATIPAPSVRSANHPYRSSIASFASSDDGSGYATPISSMSDSRRESVNLDVPHRSRVSLDAAPAWQPSAPSFASGATSSRYSHRQGSSFSSVAGSSHGSHRGSSSAEAGPSRNAFSQSSLQLGYVGRQPLADDLMTVRRFGGYVPPPVSEPRRVRMVDNEALMRATPGVIGLGEGWAGGPQPKARRSLFRRKKTAPAADPLDLSKPGESSQSPLKQAWNRSKKAFSSSMPMLVSASTPTTPGATSRKDKRRSLWSRSKLDLFSPEPDAALRPGTTTTKPADSTTQAKPKRRASLLNVFGRSRPVEQTPDMTSPEFFTADMFAEYETPDMPASFQLSDPVRAQLTSASMPHLLIQTANGSHRKLPSRAPPIPDRQTSLQSSVLETPPVTGWSDVGSRTSGRGGLPPPWRPTSLIFAGRPQSGLIAEVDEPSSREASPATIAAAARLASPAVPQSPTPLSAAAQEPLYRTSTFGDAKEQTMSAVTIDRSKPVEGVAGPSALSRPLFGRLKTAVNGLRRKPSQATRPTRPLSGIPSHIVESDPFKAPSPPAWRKAKVDTPLPIPSARVVEMQSRSQSASRPAATEASGVKSLYKNANASVLALGWFNKVKDNVVKTEPAVSTKESKRASRLSFFSKDTSSNDAKSVEPVIQKPIQPRASGNFEFHEPNTRFGDFADTPTSIAVPSQTASASSAGVHKIARKAIAKEDFEAALAPAVTYIPAALGPVVSASAPRVDVDIETPTLWQDTIPDHIASAAPSSGSNSTRGSVDSACHSVPNVKRSAGLPGGPPARPKRSPRRKGAPLSVSFEHFRIDTPHMSSTYEMRSFSRQSFRAGSIMRRRSIGSESEAGMSIDGHAPPSRRFSAALSWVSDWSGEEGLDTAVQLTAVRVSRLEDLGKHASVIALSRRGSL